MSGNRVPLRTQRHEAQTHESLRLKGNGNEMPLRTISRIGKPKTNRLRKEDVSATTATIATLWPNNQPKHSDKLLEYLESGQVDVQSARKSKGLLWETKRGEATASTKESPKENRKQQLLRNETVSDHITTREKTYLGKQAKVG